MSRTQIYSVTVRAFDRISVQRIVAESRDEAEEKALMAVHFSVKVTEQPDKEEAA